MLPPSWNEITHRAIQFMRNWTEERYKNPEAQTFWNKFFNIFNVRMYTEVSFEEQVKNIKKRFGFIDLFWRGKLLAEHKSQEKSLDKAASQKHSNVSGTLRTKTMTMIFRSMFLLLISHKLYCMTLSLQRRSVGTFVPAPRIVLTCSCLCFYSRIQGLPLLRQGSLVQTSKRRNSWGIFTICSRNKDISATSLNDSLVGLLEIRNRFIKQTLLF